MPLLQAARARAESKPDYVRPKRVTVSRTDSRGNKCSYHITDNAGALEWRDWLKVVAVFAEGPEWQFKGWKWGEPTKQAPGPDGKPVDVVPPDIPIVKIFSRAIGFHVHFEGEAPHANCEAWSVTKLELSRTKRYLDAGKVNQIWLAVDERIWTRQEYLLPKGSKLPPHLAVAMGGATPGGSTPSV